MVKLSIICFLMRIFPSRGVQGVLKGTFVAVCLWGIVMLFASIFECTPVSYFWHFWDNMHKGKCIDANSLVWAAAATNMAIDLWLLAVPLWQLRKLQLHWKKKLGVAVMYLLGAL